MTIQNSATRVDYKVYIAGVLVPCSSVTVTTSVPGTSSAQMTLPAHPLLLSLGEGDRLQVAIFYLDAKKDTAELQWCLLFEGYVAGQNYVSSPMSREVTFFAMSNISIFDSLYLEFLGGKGRGKIGKADKITPDEITMKGNYPRRFFTEGLKNKVYVKRPFDLIGNIFLATTGRFLDRDIASKTSTTNIDQQITKLVEIASINRSRRSRGTKYLAQAKQVLRGLKEDSKSKYADELEALIKKQPAENTELKSLLRKIDEELIKQELKKNVGKRNTFVRTPANTGFFARYFNLTKLEQHFVASPIIEGYPDKDVTKLPSGMFPMLRTSRGRKYMRAVTRQTGRKFGQGGNVSSFITNLFNIASYEVLDILAPPICLADKNGLPKGPFVSGDSKNRIVQHVTKPNTPYGLPPSCNAIFPCMVRNWNLGKQYGSMPTRVYYERASQGRKLNVKSGKKGYADHGTHVGYPAKVTRHAQDASKLKTSSLEVLVFPEEYYKGPNCVFNEISPLLYEIKKQENAGRLGEVESSKAETVELFDKGIPADQVNYIQEALLKAKAKGNSSYGLYVKQAQIDYVNGRTAGTSFSASLIFNPNIVAGFSSILFDSSETNCHMVGYVRQVTHMLSQGSSSTTVAFSNARSLRDMLTGIINQGGEYAMHPMEPLTEIREVFQVEEVANHYFGNLLYSNSNEFREHSSALVRAKESSDNLKALKQELEELEERVAKQMQEFGESYLTSELDELKLKVEDAELEDVIDSAEPEENFNYVLNWKGLVKLKASIGANTEDKVEDINKYVGSNRDTNLSKEEKRNIYKRLLRGHIVPKEDFKDIFESLPIAMRFVSRPVCTLEEYIDFYKHAPDFISGASSITGGRGRGTRAGVRYLDSVNKMAKHYRLIREFVGGPGFEPGSKIKPFKDTEATDKKPQPALELTYQTGEGGKIVTRVFADLREGDTASVQDLPDLAQDTQEVLLLYSDIISSRGKL